MAQSIVALREARKELAMMEQQLSSSRPEVLKEIRQAIQHLDTALTQPPNRMGDQSIAPR